MVEFDIQKILVPVDFGPASLNALNTAVAMAQRHDAAILLLHVVENTGNVEADRTSGDMEGGSRGYAASRLQALGEEVPVACTTLMVEGRISASIIRTAADYEADIVVLGTNGDAGIKQFIMGSNAYNVVKDAICPVLTIPPDKKWDTFRKILFPVRPIATALEKYDFLRKIIRKNEASLKILGLAGDYEKDVDFLKDLAMQLNEKLRDDEVKASTYFKVGKNMADEVLKIAGLMDADLIVITATIESSYKQFFVGPYTQHIINHSHFPVLSIKPTIDEQEDQGSDQEQEHFAQEVPIYN